MPNPVQPFTEVPTTLSDNPAAATAVLELQDIVKALPDTGPVELMYTWAGAAQDTSGTQLAGATVPYDGHILGAKYYPFTDIVYADADENRILSIVRGWGDNAGDVLATTIVTGPGTLSAGSAVPFGVSPFSLKGGEILNFCSEATDAPADNGGGVVVISFIDPVLIVAIPTSGSVGADVQLSAAFGLKKVARVTLGDLDVTFTVVSDNAIEVVIPVGATTGPIALWDAKLVFIGSVKFTITDTLPLPSDALVMA